MKNLEGTLSLEEERSLFATTTTALRNIVTAWTLWRTNWHSLPIKWTRTIERIKKKRRNSERTIKRIKRGGPRESCADHAHVHASMKTSFSPYSCKYPNISTLGKDHQLGNVKLKSSFMFSSSEPAGTLLMKQNWHKNWTTKSPSTLTTICAQALLLLELDFWKLLLGEQTHV